MVPSSMCLFLTLREKNTKLQLYRCMEANFYLYFYLDVFAVFIVLI